MGNQVNVPQFFKSQYATENLLYRIAYSFTAGDMLTLVLDETGSAVWGVGRERFQELSGSKIRSLLYFKVVFFKCDQPFGFHFSQFF